MKHIWNLCLALALAALMLYPSAFAAEASPTAAEQLTAAKKLGSSGQRAEAVTALQALYASDAVLTVYQRSRVCHYIYHWDKTRTAAQKLAWLRSLPEELLATKYVQQKIAHALYSTGATAEAKQIALASGYYSLAATCAAKLGDSPGAYGILRTYLYKGTLSAKSFAAYFRKLELLSSAVKPKVHLATVKQCQSLYPPFNADPDDWSAAMEMLDYKKRILAENLADD